MNASKHVIWQAISAAFVILGVAVFTLGIAPQDKVQERPSARESLTDKAAATKTNPRQQPSPSPAPRREENKRPPDATEYSYEFLQPQFYIRHILIEHDAAGRGKITFERQGEEQEVVEPVVLSTSALGRIMGLWSELRFLDSNENYQSEKQFPHLGTMRIHVENGERKRTAEFNWTSNKQASALVNEYRRVGDQAIFLFDIGIARENQPLNVPKLMDQLELMLTRTGLSDPYQLIPLLHEVTTDEHVPLIARNHAARLLKRIEQ